MEILISLVLEDISLILGQDRRFRVTLPVFSLAYVPERTFETWSGCQAAKTGRYRYVEIRLAWLNYYPPVLLRTSDYHRVDNQYPAYFASIQGLMISPFVSSSIILKYECRRSRCG